MALFNKDWNTYKTDWQKGFAANGFAGGIKSTFQSSNSVISPEQTQILRNWNNAVKHGCTNQETFNRIIADADDNTKMYFAGLNKGKGSIEGLKNSQKLATQSTIGLTIAQTALNMAISMGLMAAISLAIKGFDRMANYAKRASEAADKAFEETSGKVQEQQEELKTLDELISKYKELKKDDTLDIEGRKEVKELQNDIADLVGTQARNLDLVNGKLDDEIKKLDEISAKEAKNAYETATANYNNAQRANSSATGDDSFAFFDGYAYTGSREKDAEKILKEYGFGNNVQSGGFFGSSLFVTDTFDNDMNMLEGAQEKADYLQSMIDVLEQNGQRATELYSGLISQRDKYLGYIDSQQGAANTLVSSWITYSQHSNDELSNITVNSVESFEVYRQKMIELAKNDESIGKILSDGTLSEKDLEKAVNDFMATSTRFSTWYKQWVGDVQDTGENTNKMTVSLSELEKVSDNIKPLGAAFKELSDDGYITIKTLKDMRAAAGLSSEEWTEYESKLLKAKVGSSEFNQVMSDLTYKILDNAFASEDLSSLTEQQIAATLRENGVVNASAVAHDWLTNAKIKNKLATFDFNNATQDELNTLYKELKVLGLTENAVGNLSKAYAEAQAAMLQAATTGALNRLKISQDELKGIKTVADAYKLMAGKGYDVNGDGVGDYYGSEKNRPAFDKYRDQYNADVESVVALAKAQEEIDKIISSIDTSGTIPNDSGATKDSGSDKNEALDNYLKDAENRYKIHQNETKYIQELQYAYDNLTKNEKERLDITGKINEAYRDLADNRIKDIEHQIDLAKELHGEDVDVTGYYDKIQNIAHEEANRLRAMGYDDNSNEIQGLQKTWWDAENSKLDFYTKQHENIIRDIEHARDMALEQNPYLDTTPYYKQMQEEYHKQAERLRALDPEKYKEEIQKLQQSWMDAQEAIADWSYSNSERWISERSAYNDWELYGDSEITAWQRVLKRFQTEFPNELEKIKDIEQKIFELRKEEMEKSIEDINDYIDARNTYNDWDAYGDSEVKAVQRQTKIIEDMYNQRLLSYEEYIDKLEEQSQRIYSLGQDRVDKHLSDIDKYINARNLYSDWDDFGDTEIGAIEKQLKVLKNAYRLNLISYEEYTERFAEYTQKLYSAARDNIIKEVSKLIEDYEEMKNLESSQLESQKTLLQSYYDVTNAVAEAQHEINKELQASMTMHEYLNEETRKSLFNQEDYNALNKELLEIQSAADELQKQYQDDILNANAETIAEITSQYQMQYETMMKQYEIAKAELEVAKKRQQLDNVLAERNTRMFINGQWQWVAKTQDVINAQNELADAEIERKKQEASLEQTDAINEFTSQINSLETDLKQVRKYWSDMQEMLNGESDEVAKALKEISKVSSPELKRVIGATGGTITSFSGMLSESTETMSDIIDGDRGFGTMAGSISTIITDLENYSDAIQALTEKINGSSNGNTYKVNPDGKAPAGLKVGDEVVTAGGTYKITGVNADGSYTSTKVSNTTTGTYNGSYAKAPSGSSGGSSSSSSTGKTTQTDSGSSYNSNTNFENERKYLDDLSKNGTAGQKAWAENQKKELEKAAAKYKYADGTRYTHGGMTLMGEDGEEFYIPSHGRLIPINQPTIGNIGAGGIVFNREQMANLRNLWDLSNLSKVSSPVSSSSAHSQSTVIDNSIHINGLTVGEQGNEDWINGLRRYVATHK